MNHSGAGHLKGMFLIAAGAFALLLLLGKSAGEALTYAALLACPLMMVGMMFGGHGGHGARSGQDSDDVPAERESSRHTHH